MTAWVSLLKTGKRSSLWSTCNNRIEVKMTYEAARTDRSAPRISEIFSNTGHGRKYARKHSLQPLVLLKDINKSRNHRHSDFVSGCSCRYSRGKLGCAVENDEHPELVETPCLIVQSVRLLPVSKKVV